jgi:DNA-binding NtrC family response regulator
LWRIGVGMNMVVLNPLYILIVEDEPLIRMDVAEMLTDAGFAVIEATDADQAVAILEGTEEVWLMISDVRMAGSIDGTALAAVVQTRWPAIRVLLTSGYDVTAIELPYNTQFISKPFHDAVILEKVNDLAYMH